MVLSFDEARRGNGDGAAAWILWIRNMNGKFENISDFISCGIERFSVCLKKESRDTKYKV